MGLPKTPFLEFWWFVQLVSQPEFISRFRILLPVCNGLLKFTHLWYDTSYLFPTSQVKRGSYRLSTVSVTMVIEIIGSMIPTLPRYPLSNSIFSMHDTPPVYISLEIMHIHYPFSENAFLSNYSRVTVISVWFVNVGIFLPFVVKNADPWSTQDHELLTYTPPGTKNCLPTRSPPLSMKVDDPPLFLVNLAGCSFLRQVLLSLPSRLVGRWSAPSLWPGW